MVRYILMDIEGTTTSISFVHDVLFPYAKSRMTSYLEQHKQDPALLRWTDLCRQTIHQQDGFYPSHLDLPSILVRWIDEDRKHPGLKAIEGMIWEEGYRTGAFTADVYDDVLPCLEQWRVQEVGLGIFSSGSEQAQRLLFAHTDHGDLIPYFTHFFDTRIGGKRDPITYTRISQEIRLPPPEILFLSDVEKELDAAVEAGLRTTQIVRPGTQPGTRHSIARDFSGVNLAT